MPVPFHRSPQLEPRPAARRIELPAPPRPQPPQPFPGVATAAPVAIGLAMLAVTRSPLALVLVAMSPLLALGAWLDQALRSRRTGRSAHAAFEASLDEARRRLGAALTEELAARCAAEPSTEQVCGRMLGRTPRLWSRSAGDEAFLRLRLGLGRIPARTVAGLPNLTECAEADRSRLEAIAAEASVLEHAPAVVDLGAEHLGIAGTGEEARAVARALLLQLAGLHSPAELHLAVLGGAAEQGWIGALPHLVPPDAVLGDDPGRAPDAPSAPGPWPGATPVPVAVLVLDADDEERTALLARLGRDRALHCIWVAPSIASLPSACRALLDLTGERAVLARAADGGTILLDAPERCGMAQAARAAEAIRDLVDADAPGAGPGLPGLVEADGLPLLRDRGPDAIAARWREPPAAGLAASLGLDARGAELVVDLRADGPHALIAGTTGSGKSELLQTWLLALAARHRPDRLNLLLVDCKGGAAFAGLAALPHAVGLVTDLAPGMLRRALVSLRAELHRRERILAAHGAKDLPALEAADPATAPPALVIAIDEYAALLAAVPDFADGVADLAQRGRSLGLHLLLATQRPTGVVREDIRANASIRIALRTAGAADSIELLGAPTAAAIPADSPGRAIVRLGGGRPTAFQTARPGEAVQELVAATRAATRRLALPPPRRPWLPPLPEIVPLDAIRTSGRGAPARLPFGIVDQPARQRRATLAFDPVRHGHLLLVGRGGSGRTTALRTLAAAAGRCAPTGEAWRLYAIDAGRGLGGLEALPLVGGVVPLGDEERLRRLVALLLERLDRGGPRTLLLLDGLGPLREGREHRLDDPVLPGIARLLADGRARGVHVAATADRPAAVPGSLLGAFGLVVALRPGTEADAAALGIDPAALRDAPPGRAVVRGQEAQLAVVGRTARVAEQRAALAGLADRLLADGAPRAPAIPLLAERIPLAELPPRIAGRPALGVTVAALTAVGVPESGILLVAGPPRSGRTTAIRTLCASACRAGLPAPLVVERAHALAGRPEEAATVARLRAARESGGLAIVEVDPARIGEAWALASELRQAAAGLFLQAEEGDALALLRVPLPGARRAGRPPGRGWLVVDGVATELQTALPPEEPAD